MLMGTKSDRLSLTSEDLDHFEREGWLGPFSLLEAQGVERVMDALKREGGRFQWAVTQGLGRDPEAFRVRPWFKSLHVDVPEIREVAAHPAIVDRIGSILGPEVVAWGVTILSRKPGQVHRWHVDIEHVRWRGVSAFVAMKNVSRDSTLNLISRSHRIDDLPQDLGITTDEQALEVARRHDPASALVRIPLREREFFLFEGRLWHGSRNNSDQVRTAMIAQYSRPGEDFAIPLTWNRPIVWHPTPPPVVVVKTKSASDQDSWG